MRRRYAWVGVMLLDALVVMGITMVLGTVAIAVGARAGWGSPAAEHGTIVLEDGTVRGFQSHAESAALTAKYRGRIRSATFETSSSWASGAPAPFAMVYLVGLAYVSWIERRRLRSWLRTSRRRLVIGVAFGVAAVAWSVAYEFGLGCLGLELDGLGPPFRQVGFWAFFALAAVAAPLGEELYFRGRLFRLIEDRNGGRAAFWITTVLFAAIHVPTTPAALPAYLFVSFLLGWQRLRSGTLDGPIATHATNNGIAVALAYLGF